MSNFEASNPILISPSLHGLGGISQVTLNSYRSGRRLQELLFDLAQDLTADCIARRRCEIPPHALFPQILTIAQRFVMGKVKAIPPFELRDAFLSPYYGLIVESLSNAIGPDTAAGDSPELPRYEARRGAGSSGEVDFWTSRDVREVSLSHVNFSVADTKKWEQSTTYMFDTHPATKAFVKNAGLGFAIPYIHNGQMHEYLPDFIVRLQGDEPQYVILETKGFDEMEDVKRAAAIRWTKAVNAEGSFGSWDYRVAKKPSDAIGILNDALKRINVAA